MPDAVLHATCPVGIVGADAGKMASAEPVGLTPVLHALADAAGRRTSCPTREVLANLAFALAACAVTLALWVEPGLRIATFVGRGRDRGRRRRRRADAARAGRAADPSGSASRPRSTRSRERSTAPRSSSGSWPSWRAASAPTGRARVVVFDIDHFKRIQRLLSATPAGDQALPRPRPHRRAGQALLRRLRPRRRRGVRHRAARHRHRRRGGVRREPPRAPRRRAGEPAADGQPGRERPRRRAARACGSCSSRPTTPCTPPSAPAATAWCGPRSRLAIHAVAGTPRRSDQRVPRRRSDAVDRVAAEVEVLGARRVVQRVRARVAPVPVEAVPAVGRAAAREVEDRGRDLERRVAGERLGRRDGEPRLGDERRVAGAASAASSAAPARASSASAARTCVSSRPASTSSCGSSAAALDARLNHGRARSRRNAQPSSSAPRAMPTSTATCISCPNARERVRLAAGPIAPCSTTHAAGTATSSSTVVPLNVARWPNAFQSWSTCTPGASRGHVGDRDRVVLVVREDRAATAR